MRVVVAADEGDRERGNSFRIGLPESGTDARLRNAEGMGQTRHVSGDSVDPKAGSGEI